MGSRVDVVKGYYDLAWSNPPASITEAVEVYFSDDFKSFDKDGNVAMTKEMLIGMGKTMAAAFPDVKAITDEFKEEGEGVLMKFHFEGTHLADFDLSPVGLGVIPASGKRIVWPTVSTIWIVEGDKIVGEKPQTDGMGWFLEPLGVKLPQM